MPVSGSTSPPTSMPVAGVTSPSSPTSSEQANAPTATSSDEEEAVIGSTNEDGSVLTTIDDDIATTIDPDNDGNNLGLDGNADDNSAVSDKQASDEEGSGGAMAGAVVGVVNHQVSRNHHRLPNSSELLHTLFYLI